ncbi:uncharacterized protein F5891DRAFT_974653 [Suillus fuscotomentosus]|uniref:Integrase core domain-containing protein n=1 Tax=Suillus fuscotomentosus TaxID=1912939 RepID=A0AAD4EKW5_9AGAM|nr:uncharacterized protein F5891DRAFT_974653 [Suillus fuscotomentosus]KAG1908077.1 hypothetical protein F5891DRAFT_974653 [Suillus fuscotomentosus]
MCRELHCREINKDPEHCSPEVAQQRAAERSVIVYSIYNLTRPSMLLAFIGVVIRNVAGTIGIWRCPVRVRVGVRSGIGVVIKNVASTVCSGIGVVIRNVAGTVRSGIGVVIRNVASTVRSGIGVVIRNVASTVRSGISVVIRNVAGTIGCGCSLLVFGDAPARLIMKLTVRSNNPGLECQAWVRGEVERSPDSDPEWPTTELVKESTNPYVRMDMGLLRTRQQGHTVESIHDAMLELREMYPKAGMREIISLLHHEEGMSVSRRRFWAAGVNDIVAVDQHDKWLQFGLALHTGIEPFSGLIMWMQVWHSNRNLQLILSYYLDTIENLGCEYALGYTERPWDQKFWDRQWPHHVASMHRWMRTKKNVMPEIAWSQLRRRFTPGFESLLDHGVEQDWYDSDNTLQVMVFQWVFIPWLQRELDSYQDWINHTAKRCDRNKVLPHGIPELIYRSTEDFGALDFKIKIEKATVDHVRATYIKPGHPVFDLVPSDLGDTLQMCYECLGHPVVNRKSAWTVYLGLLHIFSTLIETRPQMPLPDSIEGDEELLLLQEHRDLPFHEETNGYYYMGGVRGGLGLDDGHHQLLNDLTHKDEPDVPHEADNAGLVVWEFSDEEAGAMDEW